MLASSGLRASSASDPKTCEGYVARCLLRCDAPVDRSSRVFVFRSEDKRRRKSSVYAPEVLARLFLPTRRQAKAGISCVHSRCRLRYSCRPVFLNLRRTDRRWCPQQEAHLRPQRPHGITESLIGCVLLVLKPSKCIVVV